MSKQRKTLHHLNPRSRVKEILKGLKNPPRELIKKIREKKLIDAGVHDAWHFLFSNMFVWEAVRQIKLWANTDLSDFKVFLNFKQRLNWNRVFGYRASPRQAIKIIERDWMPPYPLDNKEKEDNGERK